MANCSHCQKPLPTTFVKCLRCKRNYHFNPCCPLSENTYAGMGADKKADWRCHMCRERRHSTNSLYETVIYNETIKQRREDDTQTDNDSKRYKEDDPSISQSETSEIKSDIKEIKESMAQMVTNLSAMSLQFQNSLKGISESIANLTNQVADLQKKNTEKEQQIIEMDAHINKLEQKIIEKNIEINNVQDKETNATEILKKIGAAVNVNINDGDISNAYRTKRNDRVVVEFSSLFKKRS